MENILFTRRYFFLYAVWWLLWALLQYYMVRDYVATIGVAWLDSVVSNFLLGVFCLFIANNFRFYIPKREKYRYVFVVSLALGGLWLLLCKYLLEWANRSAPSYTLFFEHTKLIRFSFAFLQIGFMSMLSLLWYSALERQEEDARGAEIGQMAVDAELFKLRQQLQPHFLFNSLNSINALIRSQPEQAKNMIVFLAEFLRGTLKREDRQLITWQEEIHYLNLYLEIEKVRFGNRLVTLVHTDKNSGACLLPALLLQPILENAIKYGLYGTLDAVEIRLEVIFAQDYLQITIANPYDKDSQSQSGTGFGLRSVRRRLYLIYGRNDLLAINNTQNDFIIHLKIPQAKQ